MAAPGALTHVPTPSGLDIEPMPRTLLACPDARPPAYQAAAGLAQAGMLDRFVTGYYYRENALAGVGRTLAGDRFARVERSLRRRTDDAIPGDLVTPTYAFDLSLQVESRVGAKNPAVARKLARARTRSFDRLIARAVERRQPDVLFAFSDVASDVAIPTCQRAGIPTIVSMVHGDVREEMEIIARESAAIPDFERHYLGDGVLDRAQLAWIHERRLRDAEGADLILVPSEHIASELARHGTPRAKVQVVPYAADVRRFRPDPEKRHTKDCTFLFAGGISLRKGVHHLLAAWERIRRPGWRLQLLGAPPRDGGPIGSGLASAEVLGRLPHSEVAAVMAAADVFVFPSLFEGSAVVTYEALACGLPCVVTPNAGSVVRDGVEGLIVGAGDVDALAEGMEELGLDPARREGMSIAARVRAEQFDWPRYHESVADAVRSLVGSRPGGLSHAR